MRSQTAVSGRPAATRGGRPSVHDAALRLTLLDRACEMLSEDGPAALSLRRLAGDVGTSTTAIYSLFGSKADLLRAINQEAWLRFARHLRAIKDTDDAFRDIVDLGLAYRASAEANPHYYQVMVGTDPVGEPGEPRQLPDTGGTFELLVSKVERYFTEQHRPTEDVDQVAVALWSAVHGVVSLEITGILHSRITRPAVMVEQVVRAVLAGWPGPEATTTDSDDDTAAATTESGGGTGGTPAAAGPAAASPGTKHR